MLPQPPRRVIAVIILMIMLTSLPYAAGAISAPVGTRFSGAILDLIDYHSHLAKMHQGLRGEWLYRLLFTAEPHPPILLQTFYVALGHVARLTGLSLDITYQVARVVSVAFMVWAIWAFMLHYLSPDVAWWALLLALFGGGWSFLLWIIAPAMTANVSPIEFWLLDAYTFLAAFISPHFAIGIGLLALAFLALDHWTSQQSPRSLLTLWLATFAIAMIQPFDLLLVDSVLVIVVVYRLWKQNIGWHSAVAGLMLLGVTHGAILGYDWLMLNTPIWKSFADQNITLSPSPIYYVLGYAPLLIPAVTGIVVALRRQADRWLIPGLWIVGVIVLVYAPLATQRRFVLGVQVPMAALAVYWLSAVIVPALKMRIGQRYRSVLLVYGALATLSTIIVIVWLVTATRASANAELYIIDNTVMGWDWIQENTSQDSVILSGFHNGGAIPARTGRRVVLGHWIETADYLAKRDAVGRFFVADTADNWRLVLLQSQGVDYMWYSDEEKALGSWNPAIADYLRPVFESATLTLYQVKQVEVK
jgi:hypothetical protein